MLARKQFFAYKSSALKAMSSAPMTAKPEGGYVRVTANGKDRLYPSVWLRDNCQCEECFNKSSTSRKLLMKQLDPTVEVNNAEVTKEDAVNVTWTDGHSGSFSAGWLLPRAFDENTRSRRESWYNLPLKLWKASDMKDGIPRFKYDQIIKDDHTLYNWLVGLEQIGLSIIEESPSKEGTLKVLGERVSHLKRTNYGKIFTVKAKMDPSNLAYTPLELGMHTDLPYYYYAPGVQMLHCLKQVPTKGGENEFVDCFQVGELMRKSYPEEFELLTTSPVDYKDVGEDCYSFHLLNKFRIIELDKDGSITRIVWNNMMRDSFLTGVPLEKVKPLYKAMKLFHDLMYHEDNVITTKLEAGEIACFHNYRVLHGRTTFEVIEEGQRHYEGAYLDWDEVSSRRRTIKRTLEPDTFGY